MTQSRRGLILSAAAFAAAPALALADGKKGVPAKKIFPYLDLYLSIPPADRTRFLLAYYLKVNERPAAGVTLWLAGANGGRTALTTGPDGRVTRLPTLADLKAGAMIEPEKKNPSDKFGIAMEMEPIIRLAETMPAADLAAAIEQCNRAIKARAGVVGFAVPKMEQVVFLGAASGHAIHADGRSVVLPTVRGAAAYRPAGIPGAVTIKLAKSPSRAFFAGGKA